MDLQGPLNITPLGNQYILVIQDIFTKFVVATPLIDASADTVSRIFLAFWVGPFGVPARLLTDNGSNFTSDLMADLFIVLRIQKIWTSPYHPQTDGSVERFNRTLNNMVSHFVNDRQDNWDSVLPLLALAYNSTFNTTVNNSPFFLWYGREAPTVASLLAHIPAMDQASYGEGLKLAMKSALAAAYNNIIQRQNQSDAETADINNSVQFQEYSVGEEVLILDNTTPPGQKPKYRRRWIGPFLISSVNGPLSYAVTSKDGLKTYRAHAEHLKRVYVNQVLDHATTQASAWPSQTAAVKSTAKVPVSKLSEPLPNSASEVSSGASSSDTTAAKPQHLQDKEQARPARAHRLPVRYL